MSVSRRRFLQASAGTATAIAIGAGLHYFRSDNNDLEPDEMLKRQAERLTSLDKAIVNHHLDAIEGSLLKKTSLGVLWNDIQSINFMGQKIPEIDLVDSDESNIVKRDGKILITGSGFQPITDNIRVVRIPPMQAIKNLALRGHAPVTTDQLHEALHWLHDQFNIIEPLIDEYNRFNISRFNQPNPPRREFMIKQVRDPKTGEKILFPATDETKFAYFYGMKKDPDFLEKLTKDGKINPQYIEELFYEGIDTINKFSRSLGLGGRVLTETHAMLIASHHDWEKLTPDTLKESVFKSVRRTITGQYTVDDRNQEAAWQAVTQLHAVVPLCMPKEHGLAGNIWQVGIDIGQSMHSYDPDTGRFVELDRRVEEYQSILRMNPEKADKERKRWLEKLIRIRAKDQDTTRRTTRKYLDEHFSN